MKWITNNYLGLLLFESAFHILLLFERVNNLLLKSVGDIFLLLLKLVLYLYFFCQNLAFHTLKFWLLQTERREWNLGELVLQSVGEEFFFLLYLLFDDFKITTWTSFHLNLAHKSLFFVFEPGNFKVRSRELVPLTILPWKVSSTLL